MRYPSGHSPEEPELTMTDPIDPEPVPGPNLFTLNGESLFVTLALSGVDGKPTLTYQDSQNTLTFTGEEIVMEDSTIGRLASVTTTKTPDIGYTTFTLVLPVVSKTSGQHTVSTIGVTAMHRRTLGGIGHGQLTSYHVTTLRGAARLVDF